MTQLAYNLRQPFQPSIRFSQSFPFIIGFAVYVVLFIFLFKPFGIEDHFTEKVKFEIFHYGFIVIAVMSTNYYFLPLLFPTWFDEKNWSFGREISWVGWNCFCCCIAVAFHGIYTATVECPTTFSARFGESVLVSILPMAMYVMYSYNGLIRQKMHEFSSSPSRQKEKSRSTSDIAEKPVSETQEMHSEIRISSENDSEFLNLPLQSLRYIESRDNYSLIVWWDGRTLRKQMLRSSLKRLAGQIEHPAVQRCHRSYIVNLCQVDDIRGNSRGYRLYLHNCADEIPVSRENGGSIKKFLKNVLAA
ncbi:MAG: LytTR family transcriptional regulator DNA-binding domain-containing protein [Calditrichota bacterium]